MFGIANKELDSVRATEAHLHKYSSLGLRTLVIGMRELSHPEFEEWQSAYENASTAVLGRGNLLRSVATNIECNIHILGATGIEDKLQDGVPEAIESLRQAGMKVWILTGDKQETAISIGYSCKLLTNDMTQIVINNCSKESCKRSLDEALAKTKELRAASSIGTLNPESSGVILALIVDGNSLVYILETELQEEVLIHMGFYQYCTNFLLSSAITSKRARATHVFL
jgi:phospholipid-transporting ATPase